jgi:hypothetical protein
MLARILRWLGWETQRDDPRSSRPPPRGRARSATAHLFSKDQTPEAAQKSKLPAEGDFNPYNTGKFDRSASWERISKSQR